MFRLSLFLVVAVSLAAKFNIAIDYVCKSPIPGATGSESTPCKSWTQSGVIEEETSCYPGDALMMTEDGAKPMSEIQVGDRVLGYNPSTAQNEFTAVRAWLHRFPTHNHNYKQFETTEGLLIASAFHNVAMHQEGGVPRWVYAKDMEVGASLNGVEGAVEIKAVGQQLKEGMYAPLTGLSNYYVGQTAKGLFLSHAFAHISEPQNYEMPVHFAMKCSEMMMAKPHELTSEDGNYVHPVATFLKTVFPFLVDSVPHSEKVAASFSVGVNNNRRDPSYRLVSILAGMANTVLL